MTLLGINHEFKRAVDNTLNLYETVGNAIRKYISDVKTGDFPSERSNISPEKYQEYNIDADFQLLGKVR
ncbi:MAG: hypothetical protein MZU84_02955 [Sphingobacterium sp.]|nr:hypothetical protein [Sphingobacterium sp.]